MSNTGRGVLEGAFALLGALEEVGEAGLAELASLSGLPRSSAYRLLEQLTALGAVERSRGAYRVGPRIFRMGRDWQPYPGLLAAANGTVRRVAEATGATVAICVMAEGRTMAVAGVQGEIAELAPMRPGATWPVSAAAGRVLMACAPEVPPPDSLPDPLRRSWRRSMTEIRERGVAFDREELVTGVVCAAVPLFGPHGEVVASLAAIMPAGREPERVAAVLGRAAAAIGDTLRRTPHPHGGPPAVPPAPVPGDPVRQLPGATLKGAAYRPNVKADSAS
ncbi:IclR family transcriptional regulator [Streptomyces sp. NPDC001002]